MHIMEGFLPHPWWEIWFALSLPVVAYGVRRMNRMIKDNRETLSLLAVAGAFVFVLSSLKLPSVTGSCSHPTGTGMGSIIFGPWITSVLAVIVLVYQAVFLAHGGLTTLGANVFSMGIAGPIVGYLVYRAAMRSGLHLFLAVFLAASAPAAENRSTHEENSRMSVSLFDVSLPPMIHALENLSALLDKEEREATAEDANADPHPEQTPSAEPAAPVAGSDCADGETTHG